MKAMLMGYRVAEYPAVLYSRTFGTSKARLMRTILAHLGFQGRILLHRLGIVPLVESPKGREQRGDFAAAGDRIGVQ